VDKRTAQQRKVQQFESTGFLDPQAAAETSGGYYRRYVGKLEGKGRKKNSFLKIYIKFFGGKFFSATRVVFISKKILKCES
jgi:hypothetical protein